MAGLVGRVGGAQVPRRCSPVPLEERPVVRRTGDNYLTCPRCRKWRRNLYADDAGEWACRVCLHLDYRSRHEVANDPALAARVLHQKLGGSGDLTTPPPKRPKGRRERKAYDRLHSELVIKQLQAHAHLRAFTKSYQRLARRLSREKR